MKRYKKLFYHAMFLLYIGFLMWILFNRSRYVENMPYWDQVRRYLNLQPLRTIRLYLRLLMHPVRQVHTGLAFYNLVGNLLLFLPMGAMLPLIFPRLRSFPKTFFTVLLLVLGVEITQVLLLAGSCDIDDVILNMAGCILGYPFHRLLNL